VRPGSALAASLAQVIQRWRARLAEALTAAVGAPAVADRQASLGLSAVGEGQSLAGSRGAGGASSSAAVVEGGPGRAVRPGQAGRFLFDAGRACLAAWERWHQRAPAPRWEPTFVSHTSGPGGPSPSPTPVSSC
jgi:hypothetical protein